MEDMTKMANKAIPYLHMKKCQCKECLLNIARAKAIDVERNKEAVSA
jgi:hypothetical protein